MNRFFALVIAAGTLLGGSTRSAFGEPKAAANNYVQLGNLSPLKLKAGESVDASVPLKITPGYHIQSNPAGGRGLIPTTLEIKKDPDVEVGKAGYPKGKPYRLVGATNEISVYEGDIDVKFLVKAAANAKPGKHRLEGKLRYQACNEKNCFFPTTTKVEIPVEIAP